MVVQEDGTSSIIANVNTHLSKNVSSAEKNIFSSDFILFSMEHQEKKFDSKKNIYCIQ